MAGVRSVSYFSAGPPCLPCPHSKAKSGPPSQRGTRHLETSMELVLPGCRARGFAVRLRDRVCVCACVCVRVFCRCVWSFDSDKLRGLRRTAVRHLHEQLIGSAYLDQHQPHARTHARIFRPHLFVGFPFIHFLVLYCSCPGCLCDFFHCHLIAVLRGEGRDVKLHTIFTGMKKKQFH